MKPEYTNLPLVRNDEKQRFELDVDGKRALIEYREYTGKIALTHTEVEPALEGQGAATAIIEKTLAWIEAQGLQLIPLCPLVVAYLKRHRLEPDPCSKRGIKKKPNNCSASFHLCWAKSQASSPGSRKAGSQLL